MRGDKSRLTSDLFAEGDGVIVNRGRIEVDGSEVDDHRIDPDSFVHFGSVERIAQSVSSGAFSIGTDGDGRVSRVRSVPRFERSLSG